MESSQKWLEKERETEAAEVRKNENIHLSFAALEQKKDFIEENFVRIREEMGKFQEELATLNASKGENHGEIEQKEAQITEIRQTIENSKELFEEINKEIEESQKKREELNQKHKAFLKKREDLAAHMAELDKESFRLTSKKEGYEEALEKQINYMWEEYELTYNRALELRNENLTDVAKMKKRIQELKGEIRALGNVNVNAIEDYKNVSERYEFLKTQHDDLVEAEATLEKIIAELQTLPDKISKIIEDDKERIQWFAAKQANAKDAFFIGRGIDYAISMEGSLKMKEVSYVHTEAYAAGELKHGTISLIEDGTLVIGVLTQNHLYEKTVSNMVECKSRGAYLMGLTTYGHYNIEDTADFTVYIPKTDPHFATSLAVIPLQLLGYYVSVAKGLDVDKPRNLAKSVTVE